MTNLVKIGKMLSAPVSFSKSNTHQTEEWRSHTYGIEMQLATPTPHCKAKTLFPSRQQKYNIKESGH